VKYGAFAPANVVTEVDDGSGGVRRYETCTRIVFDGEPEGNVDCEVNGPEKRTTPREDVKVGAGLLADFDISRIFGMSLGYRFDASISDFGIQSRTFEINGANADPVDAQLTSYQSYMDHRVFLTLNLRY